ncbi:putative coenzyme PQQ synthesis protein C [Rickettsia argasii T170-B]|uniref:Putative coenzyme PQQ synthesis protein C n=1 Tax=Rickettsia argasii T170-B TaxID=1268837 RepID=A0A0F3RH68_9RICK|nr:putative coenzyme PQQ synthesis protein C [Rickettsia argasii T170-B]
MAYGKTYSFYFTNLHKRILSSRYSFPTLHYKCSDIQARQILLGNLIEKEQGEENHPELWKRFAEGLCLRNQRTSEPKLDST